jgi:lipopolysaccharide biosynthesis glycosyltransferase
MTYDIFVGYDPKEAIAFHTCVNSIIRHSSKPVTIHPLALANLGEYAEIHKDGSNEFSYSRFLVPYVMSWTGLALYLDGDMVVRDDITKLFEVDRTKAVHVVKHDYKTTQYRKYLDQPNEDYPRKNWSSVILWNCNNFKHRKLTPEFVQNATGEYLHRFQWLPDEQIGELPIEWNWLPDELGENDNAKLLHWTLGTPCFPEYANANMAEVWHKERQLTEHAENQTVRSC